MKIIKLLIGIICIGIINLNSYAQNDRSNDQANGEPSDSLLETYSIEELLQFKNYYLEKRSKLEIDKKNLLDIGIRESEVFIKQHADSRILDKVLMRLAELYYQKSNEDFLNELQAYDTAIERHEKGDSIEIPPEPTKDFSKSLELYQQIIDNFPHSNLLDDAFYHKAFILEQLDQKDTALVIYQQVIDEFPDSKYVPDAMMRIGEYYFNPPINNIEKAIEIYKQILYYKDSPKYDEALYRLGWSYYRLDMYPEAVSYFTILADDVERSKELDPTKKYTNPDLRDESIEYIGISFLDYGGAKGAAEYLEDIGGRTYGLQVLQKIGNVYLEEKEEYEKAIQAYQILLTMYPGSPQAPEIQNKIVTCYQYIEDDRMTYLSRNKLYMDYKPGSEWWKKIDDAKALEEAYNRTERAIRENISLLIQRAEEANDIDLYLQAVKDSRNYLKSFPADSNAAALHWNMAVILDSKLKQFDQAFDEYMKISDLYWETKYQKFAAENAIALAKEAATNVDSLAQYSRDASKTIENMESEIESTTEFKNALIHKSIELSVADQRLMDAYNNFIMLFPHDPKTAVILSNAGALYYNHNKFHEALKYFNTLVKHFPESQDIDYAKYTIMECYFGKRDFKSSEIVAKRLRESAQSTEISQKATRRLAESIFLNAETLKESNEHLKAGNEYVRVILEVPKAPFADLALFNGALEYDKAQEYRRAVETYDYIVERYPNSKYRFDAMNNQAIDYGELGENRNAAISYEKLAVQHPDATQARDALYNSSVFYVRAEDWKSAIRVNKEYVRKYPNSEDADELYFNIARYYLKLDEFEKANQIYGDYALKYPESSRVVETYFRRGEYYKSHNNLERAAQEFELAIVKSAELKGKNIDSNDYYAAEALFLLTGIKFEEFDAIEFRMPIDAMEEAKKKKKELLLLIHENYTKVARYSTVRLYEATYNIGLAYEKFAETWARQDLPSMDETRKVVAKKEINQTAAELYERAINQFQNSIRVLTRIADDFEASIEETKLASTDSTISSSTNISKGGKITIEDSTLYVARKWIERSKEKVSEIIYDVAELNHELINQFLNAPIPEGFDEISELEYRNQVLNQAVRPLVQKIVKAHARNIHVSEDMNLRNQWVELSKRRIITTNKILPNEYQKMTEDALVLYSEKAEQYYKLIHAGKDAFEISDQMATLIDYSRAFGKAAISMYQNSLAKGNEATSDEPLIQETELNLLKFVYEFSQIVDSLAIKANNRKKEYENLFKETDRIEFEDALFVMEDNYFSFKDGQREFLESGYNIAKQLGITNPWINNIILELVRTNPEDYGNLIELEAVTKIICTDNSWLTTSSYKKGWIATDFDSEQWIPAYIVMNDPAIEAVNTKRIWCLKTDTIATTIPFEFKARSQDSINTVDEDSVASETQIVAGDSGSELAVVKSLEYKQVPSKKAFFRKIFEIKGLPVSGEITLSVDDSYHLFFNSEYISASVKDDSVDWETEKTCNLTDYLKTGLNTLAIECLDEDETGSGLKAVVKIRSLPNWEEKQRILKFQMLDREIKQSLIFNKNILIYYLK